MQAFRNSEEFKNELIGLAALHREQDQYIKGEYGKMNGSFKGCSVGCLIYDINKREGTDSSYSDHGFLAEQLGVPEFICRLQDSILEGLPEPLNTEWTERLLKAIPVGVDLTPVLPKFLLGTLDKLPETDRQDVVESIKGVKAVLENRSVTGNPDLAAAEAARAARAARAAAEAAWEQIANDLIELVEDQAA